MKYPAKNVFIIGGTGFLGYYSALEFLKKGIAVSSASIPDVKLGDWFPRQINIASDNLNIFKAPKRDQGGPRRPRGHGLRRGAR